MGAKPHWTPARGLSGVQEETGAAAAGTIPWLFSGAGAAHRIQRALDAAVDRRLHRRRAWRRLWTRDEPAAILVWRIEAAYAAERVVSHGAGRREPGRHRRDDGGSDDCGGDRAQIVTHAELAGRT